MKLPPPTSEPPPMPPTPEETQRLREKWAHLLTGLPDERAELLAWMLENQEKVFHNTVREPEPPKNPTR